MKEILDEASLGLRRIGRTLDLVARRIELDEQQTGATRLDYANKATHTARLNHQPHNVFIPSSLYQIKVKQISREVS
jgi:hypothetical protein